MYKFQINGFWSEFYIEVSKFFAKNAAAYIPVTPLNLPLS